MLLLLVAADFLLVCSYKGSRESIHSARGCLIESDLIESDPPVYM